MPYDVRTAGMPVIGEASTIATPTLLPEFGAPSTIEELRDALLELWNRMSVISALYQQTEYRFPERHFWETIQALNIFNMTHGGTLPATRKDGTPLRAGDMHGDYSQVGIPLRPLIYDGEDWVSFLLDIQPGGAMIDQLLEIVIGNSQVVNAPNSALVNALRTELRDGVATDRNTLKKLSDAIDAISVPLNDLALTGNPTAPTQSPGTNNTRLASTAYADAAAAAVAAAAIPLTQKGAASGVASLDSGGKVPAGQLPSYVDDVIEAANFAALPGGGETGKIYVTLDNGKAFRWGGSAYVEIVASPGTTDALIEGTTNRYFTDARAQAALASALAGKQATLTGVTGVVNPATGVARAVEAADIPALPIAKTTGLQDALDAKIGTSQRGANNGVASLDSGGKVPSAQLPSFTPSFTTAGTVDPLDHGVVGDGDADDTAALIALFSNPAHAAKEIRGRNRNYKITGAGLTLLHPKMREFRFILTALTTTSLGGYSALFGIRHDVGTWAGGYATTTLAASVSRGDDRFDVANGAVLAAGWAQIHEAAAWLSTDSGRAQKSEVVYIAGVDANRVRLIGKVEGTYTSSATIRMFPNTAAANPDLYDITLIGNPAQNQAGLAIFGARAPKLIGVRAEDTKERAFAIWSAASYQVEDLYVARANQSGLGYGLDDSGSSNGVSKRLRGVDGRHLITGGAGPSASKTTSRNNLFEDIDGYNFDDAIFDKHPDAVNDTVRRLRGRCNPSSVEASDGAIVYQGSGFIASDIQCSQFKRAGILIQGFGDGDGVKRKVRISDANLVAAPGNSNSSVWTFTHDSLPSGKTAHGEVIFHNVGGRASRGAQVEFQQSGVDRLQITSDKRSHLQSASGYDAIRVRHYTSSSVGAAKTDIAGLSLSAPDTAGVYCIYFVGVSAATMPAVRVEDLVTVGGEFAMRADYATVTWNSVSFSNSRPSDGRFVASTGGSFTEDTKPKGASKEYPVEVTFTAGAPSALPTGAVTIADGAAPTAAEILNLALNLRAELAATRQGLRSAGILS